MVVTTAIVDMGSGINYYIQLITTILAAYCIVCLYPFKKITEYYLKLMTVVSIIALIGYILVNNTSVLEILPKMKNINDVKYGVGIIFNYIVDIPDRNCGMFWEPGLFATHLTCAIVFEMMTKKKASALRLILFSVCIFTANSSAGFVLWFLCMVLFFVRKKNVVLGHLKTIFSFVLLIAAIGLILNFDTILAKTALGENEYFIKLSSDSISDSSRNNAISHNLKMFMTDPVFGAGYATVMKNIAHVADTSTSTFLMSIFGVLGMSYTVFIVYGVLKIKNANFLSKILLLVIMIVIVNKEPHHQIFFTWILIFYLSKGFDDEKIEIEEKEKFKVIDGEKHGIKKLSKR